MHLRSFEAVTGPKRDSWLVQTTSGLIAAVGAALIASVFERPLQTSARVLGNRIASALALAGGAAYYAACGRISKIYLANALVEAAIAAA